MTSIQNAFLKPLDLSLLGGDLGLVVSIVFIGSAIGLTGASGGVLALIAADKVIGGTIFFLTIGKLLRTVLKDRITRFIISLAFAAVSLALPTTFFPAIALYMILLASLEVGIIELPNGK